MAILFVSESLVCHVAIKYNQMDTWQDLKVIEVGEEGTIGLWNGLQLVRIAPMELCALYRGVAYAFSTSIQFNLWLMISFFLI